MKSNKIKLAIVSGSMDIGGGETMAAKLAGYIDKSRFEIKMFIIGEYKENQLATLLKINEIDFVCLNLSHSFNLKDYKIFSTALKNYNPDVIHENLDTAYSWSWSIIHNKPLISTMHSDPYRRKNKKVAAAIKLKSIQGNFKIIGCSQMTKNLVKSCYNVKDRFLNHIYNPIDVSQFAKNNAIKKSALRFVAIGRLSNVKNFPLMLNAFKLALTNNEKAELYIAGNGPCELELKQITKNLSIDNSVHFLGNVENIPELLSNSDVLLLSSISEACPMVILEAMAAGLPIIATKVGGVPELVSDNGILVDSGDTDAFADAITYVMNNPNCVEYMSVRSLSLSKKYDKSEISLQYENEYSLLASKRKEKQ